MTTEHDDGGPSIPQMVYELREGCYEPVSVERGGTMWDEFAKAALSYCRGGDYGSFADLATDCANIADAMVAERKKRGIGK